MAVSSNNMLEFKEGPFKAADKVRAGLSYTLLYTGWRIVRKLTNRSARFDLYLEGYRELSELALLFSVLSYHI